MATQNRAATSLDEFMRQFSYEAEHGLIVKNLLAHPVHARADRGNAAAYFSFRGLRNLEAHVSEIAPGQQTKEHRHSCEAIFYVLAGHGHSVIRTSDQVEQTIEWQTGDLFSTPPNEWHWHINSDAEKPARYLEITTIPLMKACGTWFLETPG